jgi:hypothetical protein
LASGFDLLVEEETKEDALLYTDADKKEMHKRISKRISKTLQFNPNPLIYPGYIESEPGHFLRKHLKAHTAPVYTVTNPKIEFGFYLYTVKGPDPSQPDAAPLSVKRRFSQFTALRQGLLLKFAGIQIPPLPPK